MPPPPLPLEIISMIDAECDVETRILLRKAFHLPWRRVHIPQHMKDFVFDNTPCNGCLGRMGRLDPAFFFETYTPCPYDWWRLSKMANLTEQSMIPGFMAGELTWDEIIEHSSHEAHAL